MPSWIHKPHRWASWLIAWRGGNSMACGDSRNRLNGLMPLSSTDGSTGALNNTAAMVKLLPGAVARGWVAQSEADNYVQTVVGTLNSAMDGFSTYVPPRYMNMSTLAPTIAEESSIDAAFMALALHQYKSQSTTAGGLAGAIDALQNRFDFASFSDTMRQMSVGSWPTRRIPTHLRVEPMTGTAASPG